MRFFVPALFLLLIPALVLAAFSGNANAATGRFIDLDGDGLHDLELDLDSDGIPDDFEIHGPLQAHASAAQVADVFAQLAPETVSTVQSSTGDRFSRRESCAACMSACRSDFDAGFGSQLGLVGGAGAGGACAGGVCR